MKRLQSVTPHPRGFALVVTLSLMILLTVIAVGLLSLSAISLRSSSQGLAQAEAKANARLALMLAIGELQKEMGPDMRISSESALLDTNPSTEEIDGVAQSHWMASYNSWGDWLNTSYTPPGTTGSLKIADTYTPKREKMFRRWLLSLPAGQEKDINAPNSVAGWNNTNSVVLVGAGSLGIDPANPKPGDELDKVTRAYLTPIGKTGKNAWWISPENHKARIDLAKKPRTLSTDAWQTAQGDTAEVGVGSLPGFDSLDKDATLGERLITTQTLRPAQVAGADVQKHFFDLTAHSQGVLASVRTGRLKKDLSLLFEKPNSDLPNGNLPDDPINYRFSSGDVREPSIRPMSQDLTAKLPKISNRHFQSWTNMRHFYRMYREISDATKGDMLTSGSLKWSGSQPYSEAQICLLYRDQTPKTSMWQGNNAYLRLPVLAKLTFIYSLMSERVNPSSTTDLSCRLYLVYTPVYAYWNPYNTELRIPDNTLGCLSSTYQVLPMRTQMWLGDLPQGAAPSTLFTGNAHSFLRSGTNQEIVFKPGEIRIFSHKSIGPQTGGQNAPLDLEPGFRPAAYGGDRLQMSGTYSPSQKPGVVVQFSHSQASGNVSYGNTPGSLCHTPFWLPPGAQRNLAYNWNYPVMYQNDWFNLAQTYTPLNAPGTAGVARWVLSDGFPLPVAYAQLVIKGWSKFDYESIQSDNPAPNNWYEDWRSRNWIQSPPFYFGSSLYMSEDKKTAHTQRIDNPYVMNFGPMAPGDMPKVVGHDGNRAFLGSGTDPFEKVTSVPALELPSAPVSSLAGFSGMRINPGWANPVTMNSKLSIESGGGNVQPTVSLNYSLAKTLAYQSGVTGPGIGNSFMHPMLPRTDIYQEFDNSVSMDPTDRTKPFEIANGGKGNDNMVFRDHWDHVFLLNDALWDDYFVSALADQKRGTNLGVSLSDNLDRLIAQDPTKPFSNSRYRYHASGQASSKIKTDLQGANGYLKAAKHLMADGMFNVNSTSVAAWQAVFAGIRERQLVYRDDSGALKEINIPSDKRIAISRFDTEVSDQEMAGPENGTILPDKSKGWSGVRFLSDAQLTKLAEECVKQVKQRGPFLNFSEFINRRLSENDLGLMGALQSAIDYDDKSLDSNSINYRFKNGNDFMLTKSQLGVAASDPDISKRFSTPEAAEGSRFAGIPGYVIQSDVLKPIANTLAVRDDTFRIRAYGETLDASGKVIARAWCEAVVQRMPEYQDPANEADVPARLLNASGVFSDNSALSSSNLRFGRKFRIESFRWLNTAEV